MAKIAIRHNNIVPYGEIFYAMNEFKRTGLDKLVDGRLNVRCANYGYQYSDIMLALFSIYLCGGDHIEDITTIQNKYLSTAPGARIPSSDTIARGLKELVEVLFLRTDTFYLRASSCADRRQMYEQCKEWRHTTVNGQDMDVASSEFTDFLSDWHLRLVVQRTEIDTEQGPQSLPGMEYIYRAILTNDHDSTEEQVIDKYNQRGACEKNFDVQNNDFGWAHLPFSTMEDNTVFLLFTAMLKNFYQYLLSKVSAIFPRHRHEESPEALCLCLHCCSGEMDTCRQTMDAEYLFERQMAALLDHFQRQLRIN